MSEKKKWEYDPWSYKEYSESDVVKNAGAALNTHLANKPGAFVYKNQEAFDALGQQIHNYKPFSYDINGDAIYQQYKDKYIQQGKMAMADTMGQAAAMTGGYGNSYAATVGNQAYQAQLQNLNDIIPELYQMALDRYKMDKDDLYNRYGLYSDEYNRLYGEHRDTLTDWQNDRTYLAGRYDSERDYDYSKYDKEKTFDYSKYSDDRNLSYSEYRDVIADEQWQKDYDLANRELKMKEEAWELEKKAAETPVKTPTKDEKPIEPDEPDYSDWGAGEWEGYFATIRNSEGKSAAEEELNRMTREGLIPKNMVTYAAIGARGKLGH